jgi:hypothetical protein
MNTKTKEKPTATDQLPEGEGLIATPCSTIRLPKSAAIKTVSVMDQKSGEDTFEAECERLLDAGWEFIAPPTFHCMQDAEYGMTTYRFASFAIDSNLL